MFDEDDVDGDLGFAPAVSATGAEPGPTSPRRRSGGWRRGATSALVVLVGLISMGGAYALFANSSGASPNSVTAADVQGGHQLFEVGCITCHGANLEGVKGRGPSLIGVGSAAVDFQVSTGRMPLAEQGAQADRKAPVYTQDQIDQLAAFVQTYGGGPVVPSGNLAAGDVAQGGELFRLNCAQCHGTTGRGAPLSAGKYAPGLYEATARQIYTAMQSGPESMPVFSDNQLTPDQKRSVVAYVQNLQKAKDPGGSGIGRIGPVSEALVIWVIGVGVLMGFILWIGAKS